MSNISILLDYFLITSITFEKNVLGPYYATNYMLLCIGQRCQINAQDLRKTLHIRYILTIEH